MSDTSSSFGSAAIEPGETDGGSPPTIDARSLARIAEWVDGLRDQNLVVVYENGEWMVREEKPGDDTRAVLKSRKELDVPATQRQMKSKVTIRGLPLDDGVDALFWTESSIQKFFFPYYAAHRIMTEQEYALLMAAYKKANLIAIAHVAPSQGHPLYGDALAAIQVFAHREVTGLDGVVSSMVVKMGVREFLAQH